MASMATCPAKSVAIELATSPIPTGFDGLLLLLTMLPFTDGVIIFTFGVLLVVQLAFLFMLLLLLLLLL